MADVNNTIPSNRVVFYQIYFVVVFFNALFNNLVALFSRNSALVSLISCNNSEGVGIFGRPKSFSHSRFLLIELIGA